MNVQGDEGSAVLRARIEELERRLEEVDRAYEADRQLTAYEIHDGLVQYVTAALMQLESIEPERVGDERVNATLEKIAGLLRKSIAEARAVLRGLRLPMLGEEGLAAAIGRLIEETCGEGGIDVEYLPELPADRLDPAVEGTLYRIAQESLHNLCRHSAATRAQVTLKQEQDRVRLIVRDWGGGFHLSAVPTHRFGLEGIRKRAELAGGRAEIHSALGEGTTISVELPVVSH